MMVADKRFLALGAAAIAAAAILTLKDEVMALLPFALAENLKSEQTTRQKNDDVLDGGQTTLIAHEGPADFRIDVHERLPLSGNR